MHEVVAGQSRESRIRTCVTADVRRRFTTRRPTRSDELTAKPPQQTIDDPRDATLCATRHGRGVGVVETRSVTAGLVSYGAAARGTVMVIVRASVWRSCVGFDSSMVKLSFAVYVFP